MFSVLAVLYNAKDCTNPRVIVNIFKKIHHNYPTRFTNNNLNNRKWLQKPQVLPYFAIEQIFGITAWAEIKTQFYQYDYSIVAEKEILECVFN